MLREEVLRGWKGCKEKFLVSQKRRLTEDNVRLLGHLSYNMTEMEITDEFSASKYADSYFIMKLLNHD